LSSSAAAGTTTTAQVSFLRRPFYFQRVNKPLPRGTSVVVVRGFCFCFTTTTPNLLFPQKLV
jgi:hypothetical protein